MFEYEDLNEIWKDIPGYPNYKISNLGRIYSKLKDDTINRDDHNGVTLYNDKGHQGWSVHVLMGCVFLGNDIDDPCRNRVLFKDGDSSNVSLDNLYIEDTSDLPGEVWKALKVATGRELKDFYQVSNMGRIKSLKHYVEFLNHGKLTKKPCPELIISSVPDSDGYCFTYLACKDGSDVNAQIHRLVAAAFCPNDDLHNKVYVNHIDGNPSNNQADNLEWCTNAENAQHAVRTGLRGNWKGRNLKYPVLHVESRKLYDSISDVDRALGRCVGYCHERMTHGKPIIDRYGNIWTLEVFKDIKRKIPGDGQHCTIEEFPGKEFISLSEASLAIGRWEGYISDALKRDGVIRNKAGQEMHIHLIGDAPVVNANEVYKQKKAAGLTKPKKERKESEWKVNKVVKCIETGEIFRSMAEADRAMGRKVGYLNDCIAFDRKYVDANGNNRTFEFIEDTSGISFEKQERYRKNRCYFEEMFDEEFGNLTEASQSLGRNDTYITDRIKLKKPILSKDGQLMHFHYTDPEKEAKLQSEYYSQIDSNDVPKRKQLFKIN